MRKKEKRNLTAFAGRPAFEPAAFRSMETEFPGLNGLRLISAPRAEGRTPVWFLCGCCRRRGVPLELAAGGGVF